MSARSGAAALGFVAFVVALLVVAPRVCAAVPSRVVLLRAADADGITRQAETLLGAELRAAGFEVIERARAAELDLRADIESTAAAVRPIASLAIARPASGPAVELWLSDRLTGKLVIRRVDTSTANDAADLALKAVELLRGSLLEIASESQTPAPATEPAPGPTPADVTRFVARDRPARRATFFEGFGVGLGGAVLASFTALGTSYAPALRVSYGTARVGARLSLVGPGSARAVELRDGGGPIGVARIHQELGLLEAIVSLRPETTWQPFFSAGAGVNHTRVQGTGATPLFVGESHATFGLLTSAGVGLALRLGARTALTADVQGTAVFPPTRVRIVGQETALVGLSALCTLGFLTTFY